MENRKVTIDEVVQLSKELARKAVPFQPDCVISIERGGCFIGKVVADELRLPHYSIRVKKWYYKIPKWCFILVRTIRTHLPWPFNKIFEHLINFLVRLLNYALKPKPMGNFNGNIRPKTRILLVDDDIGCSGLTMKSASDYLRQKGFENLKTAVIRGNEKRIVTDYSVVPTKPTLLFPWPWRNLEEN